MGDLRDALELAKQGEASGRVLKLGHQVHGRIRYYAGAGFHY